MGKLDMTPEELKALHERQTQADKTPSAQPVREIQSTEIQQLDRDLAHELWKINKDAPRYKNGIACGNEIILELMASLLRLKRLEAKNDGYRKGLEDAKELELTNKKQTPSAQMRSAESWAEELRSVFKDGDKIPSPCYGTLEAIIRDAQHDALAARSHIFTDAMKASGYDVEIKTCGKQVGDGWNTPQSVDEVPMLNEKYALNESVDDDVKTVRHALNCPDPYGDEDTYAIDAFNRIVQSRAGSSGDVPVGWKIVPIEPTEEMLNAYADYNERRTQHYSAHHLTLSQQLTDTTEEFERVTESQRKMRWKDSIRRAREVYKELLSVVTAPAIRKIKS